MPAEDGLFRRRYRNRDPASGARFRGSRRRDKGRRKPWEALPVPGWEMCRVLGNLIDNGLDALSGTKDAQMTIALGETLQAFTFEISNNGPEIPETLLERIFQSGFSTKSTGRGMGLSIVRTILQAYGGRIELHSDQNRTAFTGTIAKSSTIRP